MTRPIPRLLLGMTGASSMVSLIPELRNARGRFIEQYVCVMTEAAEQMVSPELIAGLLGGVVHTDSRMRQDAEMNHRRLAASVDAALIAPATMNTLASLAAGTASNLLTLTIANVTGPIGLVPSVNDEMKRKPATQRVMRQLHDDGYLIAREEEGAASDLKGNPQPGASAFGVRRLLFDLVEAAGVSP